MEIRRAREEDLAGVLCLLEQVLSVHHEGRPDLFRKRGTKYDKETLKQIFQEDTTPVFVAVEDDRVLGYAFCMLEKKQDHPVFWDMLTLYVDDLCVDKTLRGKGVGRALYEFVLDFARSLGCYNVTLNVWGENHGAISFYEKMGMKPQKIGMETVL